ncbi:unnamed protein product [Cochlearia groenlandica]
MKKYSNLVVLSLIFMFLFYGLTSVLAKPPPVKIVSGLVTNVASILWKWLWSLQASTTTTTTTKSGVSSRSMVKYESGYNIETVFDGSKLGIDPYAIQVSPNGEELIVLDSVNSNVHKISMPLSRYGKPKLISGSQEGYTGHVDGKLKESKLNRPKGLAIDDGGNIYVADSNNMAIRKISNDGVSTIAAGGRFSDDFDLIYVSSSCSLLIVDRVNQIVREIQLHDHDCSHHHHDESPDTDLHLGTALLVAAAFFGYMLALLVRRVRSLFTSPRHRNEAKPNMTMAPYQRYPRPVRQPLIPPQHEPEKEEGFLGSIGKLVVKTGSSVSEMITGSRNVIAPQNFHYQQEPNQWPVQESFAIPEEDGPPPPVLEPRSGSNQDKPNYLRGKPGPNQNRSCYQDYDQYQNQQKRSVHDTASFEDNREKNEIVFGAVQEQDGRREAMVIKAVDFNEAMSDQRNLRPRINYMGYSSHVY